MKVTHFGTDLHTNNFQDFPGVYCNLEYGRLVVYTGTAPWSNLDRDGNVPAVLAECL